MSVSKGPWWGGGAGAGPRTVTAPPVPHPLPRRKTDSVVFPVVPDVRDLPGPDLAP